MELSPKEFRQQFEEGLFEIHWRQWSALGVASHAEPEETRLIDLEALVVSTLTLGLRDLRLLHASLEWLLNHGAWLNLPRLKRIARIFMKPPIALSPHTGPLLEPAVFDLLGKTLHQFGRKVWTVREPDDPESHKTVPPEYAAIFNNFHPRGIVTGPVMQRPPLLQLKLRGVFGVDARVEAFIYLLSHESGNSNAIAKEIFYNQRNIYQILETWHTAGVLTKVKGPKVGTLTLERKNEWLNTLGLTVMPVYVNWVNCFGLFNQILQAVSLPPWAEDAYMLSSFFRDILPEAQRLGRHLDTSVPEPDQYPGARYVPPFASKMLEVIGRLK